MEEPQFVHNKEEYPPMHSAEHILNRTMVNLYGCPRSVENHIERKKSKCHYMIDHDLSQAEVDEITRRVNDVINSHVDVRFEMVTEDQIPTDVSRASLPAGADTFRLVYIGDYDVCLCVGAHVKNTSEIGEFRITSHSYSDGKLRIVFKLDEAK
ncbi:MAG: hypothetical protein KBT22_01110 [Bacteroidales bacterium]|nr:hypothetical protein [Candidatus Scybalocola fimicaballi]